MKKKLLSLLSLVLALCTFSTGAMACTAIYVGSALTADGTTIFGRSEDISNSYNKAFYVAPAGAHKAGEEYKGCYGFTYTFTKDSYSYTAFSDDNGAAVDNVCPDCGETHPHTPYQAAGTNEMGLTVTATETLRSAAELTEADPFVDTGIEEAEIPTVLLSEAATAKEAVQLLCSIYDTAGASGGSGIFIADNNETWYIENTTGTQYIAVKCAPTLAFAVPNQSVIGLVDLDDTDNVIASQGVIEVAKKAGTFVGSEADNTIDYVGSYNPGLVGNSRMVSALNHFNAAYTSQEPAPADFTISNVDASGAIVPFYSAIQPDHPFAISDVIAYYDIPGIGASGNLEIHLFQISSEDAITDTVEWVAMDNGCYNVFIPYYPMLTTDTYAAYQVSTLPAVFSQEEPADADIVYPTTGRVMVDGERQTVEGFKALPANWAESYYWTFDALSNLCDYGTVTEEQKATVETTIAQLQTDAYAAMTALTEAVTSAADNTAAAAAATQISMDAAKATHEAIVALVNGIK